MIKDDFTAGDIVKFTYSSRIINKIEYGIVTNIDNDKLNLHIDVYYIHTNKVQKSAISKLTIHNELRNHIINNQPIEL